MSKLQLSDLYSLEQYARRRPQLRAEVIAHKQVRNVHIGPNVTWMFEDRLTIQYQIQEMLRAERIFEEQGIRDELDAYNPLIPDGHNWKVTLLIEFPEVQQRRSALAEMKGIEDRCWVQVGAYERVYAIADEDLERENEDKTSAVHFLRFDLQPHMIDAVKSGAPVNMGVDHPAYRHALMPVAEAVRQTLMKDLL